MVVLINAYSGVLTSLLTATKLKPIAKTMKDIAESKDLRLTTEKNFFLQERFLVSFIYIFCSKYLNRNTFIEQLKEC